MNVTSAQSGRDFAAIDTEGLMQEIAEKTVLAKDQKLKASALAPTAPELKAQQQQEAMALGPLKTNDKLATKMGEHVVEHYVATTGSRAAVFAAGAGVVFSAVYGTYDMFMESIVKPMERGEARSLAYSNDAVSGGLVMALEVHSDFKNAHCLPRAASVKGMNDVLYQLTHEYRAALPILQRRCDEGLEVAFQALDAVRHVPGEERLQALVEELERRGHGPRVQGDAAFGIGMKYALWMVESLPAAVIEKERAAVRARDARSGQTTSSVRG